MSMLNSLFVRQAVMKEEADMLAVIENHEMNMLKRYEIVVDVYRDKLEKQNIRMELKLVWSVYDKDITINHRNAFLKNRPSLVEGYRCSVACITHPANDQSLMNKNDSSIIAEWCISAITKPFFTRKMNLFVDTSDAEEELDLYMKNIKGQQYLKPAVNN